MKKWLCLIMVALLCVSMCGCGKKISESDVVGIWQFIHANKLTGENLNHTCLVIYEDGNYDIYASATLKYHGGTWKIEKDQIILSGSQDGIYYVNGDRWYASESDSKEQKNPYYGLLTRNTDEKLTYAHFL